MLPALHLPPARRGALARCFFRQPSGAQVTEEADPLAVPVRLSAAWRPAAGTLEDLPAVFTGGWVGYTGYDTVRYVFPGARRPPRPRRASARRLCFLPASLSNGAQDAMLSGWAIWGRRLTRRCPCTRRCPAPERARSAAPPRAEQRQRAFQRCAVRALPCKIAAE
jgi:hypothetical protein